MKKLHVLILFLAVSGAVAAQGNTFLLYTVKGSVSVIDNKIETPAKIGKMLTPASSLKLGNGAIVTLICNEAAMFTIGKSGTYPLSKFGDSCKATGGSFSSNYVKYVWAQMTSHEGSPGSNRKAYMNTVGAVSRSINNIWIDPRLDTVNYCSGSFPLSWKSYTDANEFEIFLYNKDNISTPFYSTIVTKLKIPVTDLAVANKIKPGNSYYWTAAVKGEENDELKVLNYVTKESYDEFLKTLKSRGAAFETPAEQAYRLGFMLEDAHYLAEAYQYYTKAATLDSANVLYRSTLMSFKKDYEIK
ncbi:MAG TPA: hypothetical protein VIV35_07370 [Chitinophagaceae bacterium]